MGNTPTLFGNSKLTMHTLASPTRFFDAIVSTCKVDPNIAGWLRQTMLPKNHPDYHTQSAASAQLPEGCCQTRSY